MPVADPVAQPGVVVMVGVVVHLLVVLQQLLGLRQLRVVPTAVPGAAPARVDGPVDRVVGLQQLPSVHHQRYRYVVVQVA